MVLSIINIKLYCFLINAFSEEAFTSASMKVLRLSFMHLCFPLAVTLKK